MMSSKMRKERGMIRVHMEKGKRVGQWEKCVVATIDYFGGNFLLFCPKQFEKSLKEYVFLVYIFF
jgi:hypothetical protein